MSDDSLAYKMRELAKTHHRAIELNDLAAQFESGARGFYAEPQTVDVEQFIGKWVEARKLWCECTGESFI